MKTPNGRKEIEEMFGNPANRDGTLNKVWEKDHIELVTPPSGWQLYYQDDKKGPIPVPGIKIHKLLKPVFLGVLEDIWKEARTRIGGTPSDSEIRFFLHQERLDQHGGGFNFRPITGGKKLSLHSYGIAIDWDPDHNPRQKSLKKTLPDWWYDIWRKYGWRDGRTFPTPDPMHVQFATGA
jgi:D-alanyl-D-alanine carboxypeptidase-like protein